MHLRRTSQQDLQCITQHQSSPAQTVSPTCPSSCTSSSSSAPVPPPPHSPSSSSSSEQFSAVSSAWLLNAQSINPSARSSSRWKIPYLTELLNKAKSNNRTVPFIALTETWLKSYIDDAQLNIPGYNVFRSDRNARVGGRVILYSHEKLPITNISTYDDQICQVLYVHAN